MTCSTGQRKYHHKNVPAPHPSIKPWQQWPPENRTFFDAFRAWLQTGGYSQSALGAYGAAVRMALGLLDKPWQAIEPETDLARVYEHLESRSLTPKTRQPYTRGLKKLVEFLNIHIQPAPPHRPRPLERGVCLQTDPEINWGYYFRSLPEWLVEDIKAYLRLIGRNWRPERQHRATCETLSHLTGILRWMTRHAKLADARAITPEMWNGYVKVRQEAGISPTTLNHDLHRLQSFLRFLDEEGSPVCSRMELVKGLPKVEHVHREVSLKSIEALQNEIEKAAASPSPSTNYQGIMDRAWFLLMLHGGLRTCEVRFLRLTDVDIEHQRVKIEQTKGFRERLIYLSEQAFVALKTYLRIRNRELDTDPDWVFHYRSKPLSSRYCQQRLLTYGKRCDLKLSPHQLRCTCATLMLNAGVEISTIQSILGHRQVNTTLCYSRIFEETLEVTFR